ncbi:hypothetical protein RSAG8_09058, partial [Rhizoctonia solani AG-8 WAC10335]
MSRASDSKTAFFPAPAAPRCSRSSGGTGLTSHGFRALMGSKAHKNSPDDPRSGYPFAAFKAAGEPDLPHTGLEL